MARGAFAHIGLAETPKPVGATQIVVAGVATAIGVQATACQAHGAGFDVTLPVDAVTGLNAETDGNRVERTFPLPCETGTAADRPRLPNCR